MIVKEAIKNCNYALKTRGPNAEITVTISKGMKLRDVNLGNGKFLQENSDGTSIYQVKASIVLLRLKQEEQYLKFLKQDRKVINNPNSVCNSEEFWK